MKKSKVEVVDKGWNRIIRMSRSTRALVNVGIVGAHAQQTVEGGSFTMAELGALHEYGSKDGRIPARNWLKETFTDNANANELRRLNYRISNDLLSGKTNERQATREIGSTMVEMVRNRIANRLDPPNADSTVARKGSDIPLIDTGAFLFAISYEPSKRTK